MMENPATWGRAEHVVNDVYKAWANARSEGRMGLSLARQVTDALRAEGIIPQGRDADGLCDVCGTVMDAAGCPRCDGTGPSPAPKPFAPAQGRWATIDKVCIECGRDNRNGTHDALKLGGHINHEFTT